MIFRAMITAARRGPDVPGVEERVVFVEASDRNAARNRFAVAIPAIWGVEFKDLEVANLQSQFELSCDPHAGGLPPLFELFVVGGSAASKPSFVRAQIGHPLFLLEESLNQVMEAYHSLCASLQAEDSAEPGSARVRLSFTMPNP